MITFSPGMNVRKSNSIEPNPTIYGLSSIEFSNRTESNTELCVSLISEPIEQIKPNRTPSIRLCSIEFGSRIQSNTIQWRGTPLTRPYRRFAFVIANTRLSDPERKDRIPVNKLTSAFHSSVLLLIMNIVITLSK